MSSEDYEKKKKKKITLTSELTRLNLATAGRAIIILSEWREGASLEEIKA